MSMNRTGNYIIRMNDPLDGICGPITRDSICKVIGLRTQPENVGAYEKQRLCEIIRTAGIDMYADNIEELIDQMGRG